MIYKSLYQSPLGPISLLADEESLLGIYFVGQAYFERGFEGVQIVEEEVTPHQEAKDWMDDYFSGRKPNPRRLRLAPHGTAFQLRVWSALAAIPYGQTTTYGQLATELNCKSAQAIGSAVGKNPLSIVVPCHRVLGANGSLTGYAGGLERKAALLELEK
ncbi:methylated-DNA-[protein]-cysteine S-methyltransferase [Streptococcus acidominimus]|uniref:Methylated-DNA--protein-cysteine methyltransferase n=1 Tax=Streptococcus acidominimus TaxID=1326 RepID=A0A239WP24_STRAI|nr:methylated-DNA--[protein]-cysteine S-methyltransferase [Streptococcus acidominimus]SNV36251.1 methylated-DNA-[protein]-cysteine S-methyltransferase [Streptococcus acidominimus]